MRASLGVWHGWFGSLLWLRRLTLLGVLVASSVPTLAAKVYTVNGDGTVTDGNTGLTWMGCAMGQTWDGMSCAGSAASYTWDQSTTLSTSFAGKSDWRLPSLTELVSLADLTRTAPAIDPEVFPNTPAENFWSATGYTNTSHSAWYVNFSTGTLNATSTTSVNRVRLVRSDQPESPLLNTARPDSDYVDHGDGTVTHIPTGLVWQSCAKGQTPLSSSCNGTANTFTFDQANALSDTFAGQSDWRLPTIAELQTLVDYTKEQPALNATRFPATPLLNFWSATASVSSSSDALAVHFSYGGTVLVSKTSAYPIRMVRTGQAPGGVLATITKSGNGSIVSNPAGINCGAICSASFASGTRVTLSAIADTGNDFVGWSGNCTGLVGCTLTLEAAKSVTAIFRPTPFTLTATGVTAGVITDPIATVKTRISFNSMDVGKTGSVFVTAFLPSSFLSSVTLLRNSPSKLMAVPQPTAVAPTDMILVQLTPSGWQSVVGGQLIAYASGVLGDQLAAQTILNNTDTSKLVGAQFCVGYGSTAAEMNASGRMQLVATVPSPAASGATSLSCLVTDSLQVQPGWNLLGNTLTQNFQVKTLFGDANWVASVWKWDSVKKQWQFYAPGMDADSLQSYADTRSYGVLSEIKPGDGYWLHATSQTSVTIGHGAAFELASARLVSGWNLVATGATVTPPAFASSLNSTAPPNLTSLWAWDSAQKNFYFYAASLAAQGGSVLIDYVASRGLRDFESANMLLGNSVGFWVNQP